LLETVLDAYQEALDSAQSVLESAGFRPTSRVKSTGTLIEKLARGTSFKSVQDIAGLRIVTEGGRTDQDYVVRRVRRVFAAVGSDCTVVDRRATPSFGY
jgi:ppGpp synthetase/RelA/SpoT-type nucleotidyltranferase